MELDQVLPLCLGLAWLLPLASFAAIVLFGPRMGRGVRGAGYLAIGAIGGACALSLVALIAWLIAHTPGAEGHGALHAVAPVAGDWYALASLGSLQITIGYYIDALTVAMFVMVTLVATCIHIYSLGYMHEELHEVTDPLVTLSSGQVLKRRGRFHRFYQYLSLFSFSMLGLVIAGNAAMVFVFWELVGICSYLLIGFYHRAEIGLDGGQQGVYCQPGGRFLHDRRPDGDLGHPGHLLVRGLPRAARGGAARHLQPGPPRRGRSRPGRARRHGPGLGQGAGRRCLRLLG